MVESILALDFLEGRRLAGQRRIGALRDVGDQCLLYSGLFPRRARRRRVPVQYFVDLGRSAYAQLAEVEHGLGELFERLSRDFVVLMDVLQAMKALGQSEPLLDPWEDAALWRHTGSRSAHRRLQSVSQALRAAISPPLPYGKLCRSPRGNSCPDNERPSPSFPVGWIPCSPPA